MTETLRIRWAAAFAMLAAAFLFLALQVGITLTVGSQRFLIDLLPDVVGYILIVVGLNRLLALDPRVVAARNLALLLNFLAIGKLVQYSRVTPQPGRVVADSWASPLWPLDAVVGLLQLVLVWMLCGLVARLAKRAGDSATRGAAIRRRAAYVLFVLLLLPLPLVAVGLSGSAAMLLVGGVIVIGLVFVVLMSGLMNRAKRICETVPDPSALAAVNAPERDRIRPGVAVRLLTWLGIALPIIAIVFAARYYTDWKVARDEVLRDDRALWQVRSEFRDHIHAGRADEAYKMMSPEFRGKVSPERFADLVQEYVDLHGEDGTTARAMGLSSGATDIDEHERFETDEGWFRVDIKVVRPEQPIYVPRPIPPHVDEFKIEEEPASGGPNRL